MNDSNLIPINQRTKSEQREICSKGGKASGIARGFKSSVRKKFKDDPALFSEIVDMLTDEAVNQRNLKAVEMLVDLMGESVQRETLSIRKKELRLKEKAIDKVGTGEPVVIIDGWNELED